MAKIFLTLFMFFLAINLFAQDSKLKFQLPDSLKFKKEFKIPKLSMKFFNLKNRNDYSAYDNMPLIKPDPEIHYNMLKVKPDSSINYNMPKVVPNIKQKKPKIIKSGQEKR